MVGWGGQLGGIQNQPGGFDEKRLVTLLSAEELPQSQAAGALEVFFFLLHFNFRMNFNLAVRELVTLHDCDFN